MNRVCEALFGPLAALECRRSLGHRWVLVVRGLAAVPPALVVLSILWVWWFRQQVMREPLPSGATNIMPVDPWMVEAVSTGLLAIGGMLVTIALLVGPALLAGAVAGEKVRSTLALLLAAQVSSREIVLGRLVGRLCIVSVFVAAGVPALVFLAGLRGLGAIALTTLVALPAAVAFGGGGLTMAASAMARRGRDALLVVYLLDLLLLLAPLFGSGVAAVGTVSVASLNPYAGLGPLAKSAELDAALATIGLWTLLGATGCTVAAWRLRPTFLREANGRPAWHWLAGRGRVPPVGDRPVLWKELYIEHVQAFGRVVTGLGILIAAGFLASSLGFAGLVAWHTWFHPDSEATDWAHAKLNTLMDSSWALVWLIQWAMGLRAAAAIASERQRGTWDGLLVSPLDGREIVLGKIYGGVYALRGFVAAVVIGWTAALACGALPLYEYGKLVADALVVGVFMVVLGIACSLYSQTATKAMTLTIVGWLAAALVMAVLAGIVTLMVMLATVYIWLVWNAAQLGTMPRPPLGSWTWTFYHGVRLLLYASTALLVAAYCRAHFDRLAGRSFSSSASASKAGRRHGKGP